MTRYITLFLIILLTISATAQDIYSYTDSLRKTVTQVADTDKVTNLNLISRAYRNNHPDSALIYAKNALEKCNTINNNILIAKTLVSVGIANELTAQYDSALFYLNKAINVTSDKKILAATYNSIGIIYEKMGDYEKAIQAYLKSLPLTEELKYFSWTAMCNNNIGVLYKKMGEYDQAITFYQKSKKIYELANDKEGLSYIFINISGIEYHRKNYKAAISYSLDAVKLCKETNNNSLLTKAYNNLVEAYMEIGELEMAKLYLDKTAPLFEYISNDYEKASFLLRISEWYSKMNNNTKAMNYANSGLEISLKIKSKEQIGEFYYNIAEIAASSGNFKSAYAAIEKYMIIKDSLLNENMQNQIAEMQTKYETEQTQKENELLIKDQKLQQEALEKQRIIIISFILGFAIILIFTIIILRQFRAKKKANKLLRIQNEEIRQKNEEISAQRDEIEAQRDEISAQRDLVADQKDQIELIHNDLKDSIIYAERIQKAVLPSEENLSKFMPNHFVVFKPKDIVSGDFYWAAQLNEWNIIAVADCTGHGVPGAFMSMLGISFLNEIIRKKEVAKTSQVLNMLRKDIVQSLKQKGTSGEQKDGMDISLIAINKEKKFCQFSGANNPLYVVRENHDLLKVNNADLSPVEKNNNAFLFEIKGDKMPIAIYLNMKEFAENRIELYEGDKLYLFSDGFADQFGGPKGKKFKYKSFKNLLLSTHSKTLAEQKTVLEASLEKWMNTNGKRYEQIDDITVMGIEF
ncbi:MAG: hypothetical protein C0594_02890 [Marinilabiliales bacterium]|nr:MAG: hypothetical protein C0594_02890 [Marinilabiliales bacterium]